ncbi:hypothetical protein FRB91_007569 [Serendipita sp. 411]|nr:hypothetical protein FRB91_007569 [Serendipita sp. 411]
MSATLTVSYHVPLSHPRLPSAPGANIAQNSSNANANVGGPVGATNTASPPSEPSPPVGFLTPAFDGPGGTFSGFKWDEF